MSVLCVSVCFASLDPLAGLFLKGGLIGPAAIDRRTDEPAQPHPVTNFIHKLQDTSAGRVIMVRACGCLAHAGCY